MNSSAFDRLRALRDENDEAGRMFDIMRLRFARLAQRHENGTAPRAVSAFQLFQTPPALAKRLAVMLPLFSGSRVLEPSAGLGRIVDAVMARGVAEVVAVEMAADCAAELYRIDRPGMKLMQRDFLTVTQEEIGLFDAVAMNPPFHMRADIRHVKHALRFLKSGGVLAAICFNTEHRRRELKPIAATWEELPAGTFGKEGTQVETVLMTYVAP